MASRVYSYFKAASAYGIRQLSSGTSRTFRKATAPLASHTSWTSSTAPVANHTPATLVYPASHTSDSIPIKATVSALFSSQRKCNTPFGITGQTSIRHFSCLAQPCSTNVNSLHGHLLEPSSMLLSQERSYKTKGKLKRRCASCYFVKRLGRLYVDCKKSQRHKQMQILPRHKIYRENTIVPTQHNPLRDVLHYKLGVTRVYNTKAMHMPMRKESPAKLFSPFNDPAYR